MFLGRSFFSFHMGDAISVCPFYFSRADITPSEYVPLHWAFYPPKDPEQLRRVYDLGYRDTLTWLKKNGQIPYGAHGLCKLPPFSPECLLLPGHHLCTGSDRPDVQLPW